MKRIDTNSIDAYAKALQTQNNGGVCEHCNSALGHFINCPLICCEESRFDSVPLAVLVISEGDAITLHALGVTWDGDNRN